MATPERYQQVYPIAPAANGHPRSDEESLYAKDEKRKKMIKWTGYIAAFTVFQVLVIVVFVLVIMKVRTPKFRVGDGLQVQNMMNGTQSFNVTLHVPIRVKNANFGPYKYEATNVEFTSSGFPVGSVPVAQGKAGFKSTKKIDTPATLSLGTNLGSYQSSGNLTLNAKGTMNGKVELMLIFKKKKSTTMDCTMIIGVSSKAVLSLTCN